MVKRFDFTYEPKLLWQWVRSWLPAVGFALFGMFLFLFASPFADWVALSIRVVLAVGLVLLLYGIMAWWKGSGSPAGWQPRHLIFYDDHFTYNDSLVQLNHIKKLVTYHNRDKDILAISFPIAGKTFPLTLSGYHDLERVVAHINTHTTIPIQNKGRLKSGPYWIGVLAILSLFFLRDLVAFPRWDILVPFFLTLASLSISSSLPTLHRFFQWIIAVFMVIVAGSVWLAILFISSDRIIDHPCSLYQRILFDSGCEYWAESWLSAAFVGEGDGRLLINDFENLQVHSWRHSVFSRPEVWEADGVIEFVVSDDKTRLYSWSLDKHDAIWDVETGEILSRPGLYDDTLVAPAFSPDGQWLQLEQIWHLPTLEPLDWYYNNDAIAISPDMQLAVTENWPNHLYVHDFMTGEVLQELEIERGFSIQDITFSPNGEWLVAITRHGAIVHSWHLPTGQYESLDFGLEVASHTNLVFSPDGEQFAMTYRLEPGTGDRTNPNPASFSTIAVKDDFISFVVLYDVSEDGFRLEKSINMGTLHPRALAYSPNGQWLAVQMLVETVVFETQSD